MVGAHGDTIRPFMGNPDLLRQELRPVKPVRVNECENTFQWRNLYVKLTLASPTIAARKFRVITENKESAKMYFSLFDMLSILWNKSCLQLKETVSSFNFNNFVFVSLILCNDNPRRIHMHVPMNHPTMQSFQLESLRIFFFQTLSSPTFYIYFLYFIARVYLLHSFYP